MSEFNSAVLSDRTFRKDIGNQGNDRANQDAYANKQPVELPKLVSSTVHRVKSRGVQKRQSQSRHWHSVRQMQYRLLILIYLLLGLSVTALVLGVVNGLTLHSLQEEVNQH